MSEPIDSKASSPISEADLGERDSDGQPPRKRQRVRLSCLECRRRKLSCDRGFPCERCIKSDTPERCAYETRPGLAPPAKNGLSQAALSTLDSSRLSFPATADHRKDGGPREADRVRRLELEVAQLRNLFSRQLGSDGSTTLNEGSPQKVDAKRHHPPDARRPVRLVAAMPRPRRGSRAALLPRQGVQDALLRPAQCPDGLQRGVCLLVSLSPPFPPSPPTRWASLTGCFSAHSCRASAPS